jgi:hypothetical protein
MRVQGLQPGHSLQVFFEKGSLSQDITQILKRAQTKQKEDNQLRGEATDGCNILHLYEANPQ